MTTRLKWACALLAIETAALVGFGHTAGAADTIAIAADHVFIPQGFDNNDAPEMVLDGEMPSSCYQVRPARVQMVSGNEITVQQLADVDHDALCAQMLVPYTTTLVLPTLASGNYEVYFADARGGRRRVGSLPVAQAHQPTRDDRLYLPVTGASLQSAVTDPTTHLTHVALKLRVLFTDSCMSFDHVEAPISARHPRSPVVDVLPVMKVATGECRPERRNEEITVRIAVPEVRGRTLFHIRSLAGKAVNLVEDIY